MRPLCEYCDLCARRRLRAGDAGLQRDSDQILIGAHVRAERAKFLSLFSQVAILYDGSQSVIVLPRTWMDIIVNGIWKAISHQ